MSKKRQFRKRKKGGGERQLRQQLPGSAGAWPERPALTSELDHTYRNIFKWSSLGILLIMVLMSFGSGINGDDEFQVDYSEKLVDYYLTAGADTSALYIEKGNMHYYGGFFDLMSGGVNRMLGYEEYDAAYHRVRHIFIALFGFLGIFFTALLAKEIAGWRAGLATLFLLFLSPRFLGHALMNPKDIPFAAGFAIALYYMVRLFRSMPRPDWKQAAGLTAGIALALATRAGGLLLVAYFFLFAATDLLIRYGLKRLFSNLKVVFIYIAYGVGISALAYLLAILTWPAALADPLNHPIEALTEFSKLGIRIRLLFMGENPMSDDTIWYYPVLWIIKTIPLYALAGFAGSFLLLPLLLKRFQPLPVLMVYFAAIFPVFYVMYKDSLLHDGWRHLMFIYPSLLVIGVLFWRRLEMLVAGNKIGKYLIWGILGLMVLESALFIVRNPHVPYVYFNPIGGGLKGAFGYYETDYWGVSVKQAINWMEQEGILQENMQDTLTIATTFYYNVSRQLSKAYSGKVRTIYVRFNQRYSRDWDYGIFPSRFIRGPHLQSGTWPNSKTIHKVTANGVPLVAIEQATGKHVFRGEKAVKSANWETAISELSEELRNHPDNELAWLGLANAFINTGRNSDAVNAADEALKVAPDNVNALYFKGLALLRSGNRNDALSAMLRAVEVNDDYYVAHYYLGLIYKERNNPGEALRHAQLAIKTNPRFKAAYELAASIYEQQGDQQNAQRYREAASRL